jgi:hypothetical protein
MDYWEAKRAAKHKEEKAIDENCAEFIEALSTRPTS